MINNGDITINTITYHELTLITLKLIKKQVKIDETYSNPMPQGSKFNKIVIILRVLPYT